MLGRGTRLSPEVFGVGSPETDKKDFYVFDVCANFDRFELNPEGVIPSKSRSLTESLFLARTELVYMLQSAGDPHPDGEDFKTRKELTKLLSRQVEKLDQTGFEVKLHLRYVERYSQADAWSNLKQDDVNHIGEHLAPVMTSDEPREAVKRFDLMMVQLQLAVLRKSNIQVRYIEKLQEHVSNLLRKDNVPNVAKKKELLTSILHPEFWTDASVSAIEHVRQEIRDLSTLVDTDSGQRIHYTNFTDEITMPVTVQEFIATGVGYESLHAKLRKIVQDNAENLTIHRLHTNQPITAAELDDLDRMLFDQSGAGTHEEFKSALGAKPLGIFIRSILGLDSQSANDAFAEFLSNGTLKSFQISFVKDLIQQFTQDGKVDPEMLWEQPFTKFHQEGVSGVFPLDTSRKIIEIVNDVNKRADVG
jgi:type I restriction enzyme R subunit